LRTCGNASSEAQTAPTAMPAATVNNLDFIFTLVSGG